MDRAGGLKGKRWCGALKSHLDVKKKELQLEVSTVVSSSAARGLGSDVTIAVIPSDCPFMLQCFYPFPSPLAFLFSLIFRLFIW